jgi:hypothetical protein
MDEFEFTITWLPEHSVMMIETHGKFAVDTHEKMTRALVAHPHWPKCSGLLANHLDSDAGHLEFEDIVRIAELTKEHFHECWPERFAIVMAYDNSLGFANATLWNVLASAVSPSDIEIFSNLERAMDWLQEPRSPVTENSQTDTAS